MHLARRAPLLATLVAIVAVLGSAGSVSAASTVKVYFGQGDQLAALNRPGSTVQDALAALIAGPTSAETAKGTRTYVPAGSVVRSVTVAKDVATVDLGETFLKGTDTESTLARLDQVVSTATAVPGIRAVRVLIKGGTPLGLFPGIDATVPLTTASLATPDAPATTPVTGPTGPQSAATLALQQQLVDLGYLDPAGADGLDGPATGTAVIAFQKWQGLPRTGIADAANARRARDGQASRADHERPRRSALRGAGRPPAVARDRGQPGRPDDRGLDGQGLDADDPRHLQRVREDPPLVVGAVPRLAARRAALQRRLRDPPVPGGPDLPASHGCVRVTQYDEPWVFAFASVGTPVRVLARST